MSRQPIAYVVATHPAMRKALCLMLAVLATLLLCQQYQRLNPPAQPLVHIEHPTALPHLSAVSAQAKQIQGRFDSAGSVDQIDQLPYEPHWVF